MNRWIMIGALAASFTAVAVADEMNGFISDSHCGAKHQTASAADSKCAKGCIKGGADPVLVSDGKVYKIAADSVDKVKAYAGDNVKVDGTLNGDTVTVASIEQAK